MKSTIKIIIAISVLSNLLLSGCGKKTNLALQQSEKIPPEKTTFSAKQIKSKLHASFKKIDIKNNTKLISLAKKGTMCSLETFRIIRDRQNTNPDNDYDLYLYYRCVLEKNPNNQEVTEARKNLHTNKPIFNYFDNNTENTQLFYEEIKSLANRTAINTAYGDNNEKLKNFFEIIKQARIIIDNFNTDVTTNNANVNVNVKSKIEGIKDKLNAFNEQNRIIKFYQEKRILKYRIGMFKPLAGIFTKNNEQNKKFCMTDDKATEINIEIKDQDIKFTKESRNLLYLQETASMHNEVIKNIEVHTGTDLLSGIQKIRLTVENKRICVNNKNIKIADMYIKLIVAEDALGDIQPELQQIQALINASANVDIKSINKKNRKATDSIIIAMQKKKK